MIAPYLTQSATVYLRTGHDSTGQPTYGTGLAVSCRAEATGRLVANAAGEQVSADLALWVGPDTTAPPGSKVVYLTVTYEVREDRPIYAFSALHHRELMLVRRG